MMAIECFGDNPTPHYANGCELLLHYDTNNDGTISYAEKNVAFQDFLDGAITLDEFGFVQLAYDTTINTVCPGCYDLCPVPTCSFTIN